MAIIIAHEQPCEILKVGPSYKRMVDSFSTVDVPTPCTCGGVKVNVDLHSGIYPDSPLELVFPPSGGPA